MFKILFLLQFFISLSFATDWLIAQGTESMSAPKTTLWGFGQLRYVKNYGHIDELAGINTTPFSLNKPDLEKQESLQLARLRIGLRGKLDEENKINYFLLTEFGQNGITNPLGYYQHSYVTDLSFTLKYLPVYMRFGMFKYPGSEEGLMARFVSPFIEFTTLSDQLMLERFISPLSVNGTSYLGTPEHSVGAYRDTGVQLFQKIACNTTDSFTYAYMYGLGAGLQMNAPNSPYGTHYFYAAYEKRVGEGRGYNMQSLKLYAWHQEGKRKLYDAYYDRKRSGLGFTYFDGLFRVEGEYMQGEGMIFTGAKDVDATAQSDAWQYQIEANNDNKAHGFYLSTIYTINSSFEAMARYDEYHRMTNNDAKKRVFENTTVGVSYKIKGFNRIDLNHTFSQAYAPSNNTAQNILNKMGDTTKIQLTLVYQ